MIVSFHTRELLERCSKLELAEVWLGTIVAQLLITMLADIEALETGAELIALYENEAKIAPNGMLSLSLVSDYCATFVAVGKSLARLDNGNPDWMQVRRLKLMDISK